MNESLLAAVYAAANETNPPAAPSASSQQQEISMAVSPQAADASAVTTVADLTAAFPDLVGAIRSEAHLAGATAERERVLGIAALADASNGSLIAEMQADGKTTPPEAALRILNAQKEARGQHLQAIVDVEKTTNGVRPAPSSAAVPSAPPPASGPDGWKAQWAGDTALQAEFDTAESYVAYQQGVASGRIKRLESRKTA